MADPTGRQPALIVIATMLAGFAAGYERGVVSPAIEANEASMAVTYSGWSPALNVEAIPGTSSEFNTAALDGCPFVSRDGKTFFMASTRPGGVGGIDIWVSTRENENDTWGDPVNVGEPINSEQNDFCPTISRDGHQFFFVSNRPGGCGGTDIYTTRFRGDGRLEDPVNLGCDVGAMVWRFSSSAHAQLSMRSEWRTFTPRLAPEPRLSGRRRSISEPM